MITKIVSGAQTGADQGALSAAIRLNLDCGGYIPRGRRTDNGRLPDLLMRTWRLVEHESSYYPPRTEANVMLGDGTVLFGRMNSPGCKLTIKFCVKHNRPYLINPESVEDFRYWLVKYNINTLNVAGNRERTNPGIFAKVEKFLIASLSKEISG